MEKLIRKTKINLIVCLACGLLLFAAGVLMEALSVRWLENNKAITSLSLIPLGMAAACVVNLLQMKKNPKGMRHAVLAETDERLVAARQQAESGAFRVLRWMLAALYFGYTFAYPADIFEAAGWWIVLGFLFLSALLPAVMLAALTNREKAASDETGTP